MAIFNISWLICISRDIFVKFGPISRPSDNTVLLRIVLASGISWRSGHYLPDNHLSPFSLSLQLSISIYPLTQPKILIYETLR